MLPFYMYRIPVVGAGDLQSYDVKQYWPFGLDGAGGVVHDVCIALALLAPLIVPASLIWSVLRYLGAATRRIPALLPAMVSLLIGVAYAAHWRAILAWHLD